MRGGGREERKRGRVRGGREGDEEMEGGGREGWKEGGME